MRKPPSAVAATPVGTSSRAAVAGPPSPEKPGVPSPATVVIVPAGETRRTTSAKSSADQETAVPGGRHGGRLAELGGGCRAAVAGEAELAVAGDGRDRPGG
jgi:hypothetical protein